MGTTIAIARRLNVGYHIPQDSMTLWKGIVYIDSLEDCENITSPGIYIYIYSLYLTDGRWAQRARSPIPPITLLSCRWTRGIFPSLPDSCLTVFYFAASSALLQIFNQWLHFTYWRSHAFRYSSQNGTQLTTSALVGLRGYH